MNTFDIEAWCKAPGAEKSVPMGRVHFHVTEAQHLQMEAQEEALASDPDRWEVDIDADPAAIDLQTPAECGELADCHFHVYLRRSDLRGQFFLFGHRASDGALIYSNAILVDELG